ncbi:NYN domain-containing protein [Guyparkeria sp. SCN-R1]|uniref:NYN domain-containing protein n=1 Tax=Guyparkeria sp. SCN-R1 TaxID=2341113 RepID=UPI000F6526A6|nr:NYN domain-containing protein [Guyparkeria sp. SCN-R1]RRQ24341.1 NYN domain-containing protein [Guyparkeria sp. SCN-R1]
MANGHGSNLSLAVLIDADNAQPGIVDGLMAEVAKIGVAHVKRIYGDWTTPRLGKWKAVLLDHSIQPMQQFGYTSGKNATDSAMIIDAMDLLYTNRFEGFCIVSSDSDFTRLAARLRESGLSVFGIGEKKTPKAFVSACDRFIYTEVFTAPEEEDVMPVHKPRGGKELRSDTALVRLARAAVEATSDENGWANLSPVGSYMSKTANDFDPRNYGHTKLSSLFETIGLFDLDRRKSGVFVRDARRNEEKAGKQAP